MKLATFFTVLISSLAVAIASGADNTAPPAIASNANADDENIIAAAAAASSMNDIVDASINENIIDTSINDVDQHRDDPPQQHVSLPRRLGWSSSITVITITTPYDSPYTFYGMPAKLKAGIYKFKYINYSAVKHSFYIHGEDGWYSTPMCAYCTKIITVTIKKYYEDDHWASWAEYYFEPYDDDHHMEGHVSWW